jgi:Alpha/beta hydrolase domain
MTGRFALVLAISVGCAGAARAEVTRVDIAKRANIGQSGYEKVAGTIHFAIDPKNPRNAIIVDLDKAPTNASGLVEFSADLYMIRPKDRTRGNGSALVEVSNRGGRTLLRQFNLGNVNPDPDDDAELGDKFLMRFGFTLVWVGWQLDGPQEESSVRIQVPTAIDGGSRHPVAGVGFAAVRDVATWLKHQTSDVAAVRYAYAYGRSQSGRFLRDFLYQGFNTDEHDRQVFDGVIAHVAGAARMSLNARGATPNDGGAGHTAFPFADASVRDPISGAQEGLLDNPRARAHQPKVFYTNTPVEYWGNARAAALVHTTPDGGADVKPPENVRIYFFAGTQHQPSRFPPSVGSGAQPENAVDYRWIQRALLLAMHRWVSDGKAPPSSMYPTLADRTLVKADALAWPPIPGVASPRSLEGGQRVANRFVTGGAGAGAPLPLLVPAVDEDGNEQAGIRLPDVAVPLATYTGWNFGNPTAGSPAALVSNLGSSIPFPTTRAARAAAKDPRRSIEERYGNRDAYLAQVEKAADALVLKGYLLIDDVPRILQRSTDTWDLIVGSR